MVKKKRGRGRPKKTDKQRFVKSGKRVSSKEPVNLNYWRFVLKSDEAKKFIEKGNDRQKKDLKKALKYIKCFESELFEEKNGKDLLKQL